MGSQTGPLVAQPQFLSDVEAMNLDRLAGNTQQVGDVLGALTLFDKVGYFDFGRGQVEVTGRQPIRKR
jgi:hypothetical protein